MDVNKALRELHEEKRRLDIIIATLEARLSNGARPRNRRGRKSMSPQERLEVSKRMSKYWEARRASAASLQSEPQIHPKSVAAAAGTAASGTATSGTATSVSA
jgi:hypothetical protein